MMYLNTIHRADAGPERLDALRFQLDAARRHGIKRSILVSYSGLADDATVAVVRREQEERGAEVGIHFHEMLCEDFTRRFASRTKAFYLQPRDRKKRILEYMFDRFEQLFGHPPVVLGSYILDAWTLGYIERRFPQVKTSVMTCFEEGVKMYQGNNHNWYLFNDGGPWAPYYPSKANALCPARGPADAIGILGLPHLNRDMILSITHRDDLFASHPINLMRAKITVDDDSPYMYRFIDQCVEQAEYNDYSYYSLFVSTPWLIGGHPFVTSQANARGLYDRCLRYLADKRERGLVTDMTMEEHADWFRSNRSMGSKEVCHWKDILCGSKRQMFWYVDPEVRLTIDLNVGGTICDLRPLAGRVDRNLGPDTEARWDGSYPFLVSSELRGGIGSSSIGCSVSVDGHSAGIADRRTTGRFERTGDWPTTFAAGDADGAAAGAGGPGGITAPSGAAAPPAAAAAAPPAAAAAAPSGGAAARSTAGHGGVLVLEPVTLTLGEIEATIRSRFLFPGDGRVGIEREVVRIERRTEHAGVDAAAGAGTAGAGTAGNANGAGARGGADDAANGGGKRGPAGARVARGPADAAATPGNEDATDGESAAPRVRITERFSGSWGTTEYPTNLTGLTLELVPERAVREAGARQFARAPESAGAADGESAGESPRDVEPKRIVWADEDRVATCVDAAAVSVYIPWGRVRLSMVPGGIGSGREDAAGAAGSGGAAAQHPTRPLGGPPTHAPAQTTAGAGTAAAVAPGGRLTAGRIEEGNLFSPFYKLTLSSECARGEAMLTWLIVEEM